MPQSKTQIYMYRKKLRILESECGKIRKKIYRVTFVMVLALLMASTVLSRLFSGVHWVTDIVAGVLWGEVMMTLYQLVSSLFYKD